MSNLVSNEATVTDGIEATTKSLNMQNQIFANVREIIDHENRWDIDLLQSLALSILFLDSSFQKECYIYPLSCGHLFLKFIG